MAGDAKLPVKIEKVQITKSSDKKLNTPASDALTAAITAAIKKSGKLTIGAASGKDKGFKVDATIHELTMDEGKGELAARLEIQLSSLPGPNLFANVKGKSKFSGINIKKIDKEVADLIDEIMKTAGKDLQKSLEDQIEKM